MNTTQDHLEIADIKNDILILKDGGGALVLQVGAVNFGLLSEEEQIAIISAFAQMLNSLSFSIQILIRSERLDISSYLTLLETALKKQTNPLLSHIMQGYIRFIQTTIKEQDVLDKTFYIIIPLFSLELGLSPSRELLQQKIKTILLPRKDQIIRQLARTGLRANQLSGGKLLKLFFEIYNQTEEVAILSQNEPLNLNTPKPVQLSRDAPAPIPARATFQPVQSTGKPSDFVSGKSKSHPFVVEELEDNV